MPSRIVTTAEWGRQTGAPVTAIHMCHRSSKRKNFRVLVEHGGGTCTQSLRGVQPFGISRGRVVSGDTVNTQTLMKTDEQKIGFK